MSVSASYYKEADGSMKTITCFLSPLAAIMYLLALVFAVIDATTSMHCSRSVQNFKGMYIQVLSDGTEVLILE